MNRQAFILAKHHMDILQILVQNHFFNRLFIALGNLKHLFCHVGGPPIVSLCRRWTTFFASFFVDAADLFGVVDR
jgi:hypothetical protein